MKDLIIASISIVTLLLGWIIGRKKNRASVKLTEAQASRTEMEYVDKAIQIWRNLAVELKAEVNELRSIVEELKVENEKLKDEIHNLRNELTLRSNRKV